MHETRDASLVFQGLNGHSTFALSVGVGRVSDSGAVGEGGDGRTATPEGIIARYAGRWSIEVMFFDVKNILGVGQARNRVRKAVERTVVFGLFCHSLLIVWYSLHGHPTTDTAHRRASAPWYRTKTELECSRFY